MGKDINYLIILLTIVILTVVFLMFIIYSFFLKKKGELLLKRQEDFIEYQKQISNTKAEMRIQTLNYIGQELHDNIGQKLSVARMMIGLSNGTDLNNEAILEVHSILGECIRDIRSMSKTLIIDNILDFDFLDAIEKEVERINKFKLLKLDYKLNDQEIILDVHHSIILFRIIQEAINNVLKHSHANEMKLWLTNSPTHLDILIQDNGSGFIEDSIEKGSGLRNMYNRARFINAKVDIDSNPNEGTRLKINYTKRLGAKI